MSCGFWIRRKQKAAKQREQERLKAETVRKTEPIKTVEPVEETEPVEKPTRKRAKKNADDGTD